MVLRRVVKIMRPDFPERGYAANELMEMLMQLLAEEDMQLLLTLDEVDSLIDAEGTDALYTLTRVQEGSSEESRRLSLLCITKDINILKKLDKSTISSLQRSLIQLKDYSSPQLSSILLSRAEAAFRKDAIPLDVIDFISELAAQEHGDARYAIDLLWRSGKYADIEMSRQINVNHVRKAVPSVFPTLKEEYINHLNLHELYVLLAISRFFKTKNLPNASTGEIELLYKVVCEEYGEKPRGHTQFWKYLNQMKGFDAVNIKMDSSSQGRTQLISLTKIPAEDLEREVLRIIEQK